LAPLPSISDNDDTLLFHFISDQAFVTTAQLLLQLRSPRDCNRLKDRAIDATGAGFGIRCGGMRLQSSRKTVSLDAVSLHLVSFASAEWQS
jgi:hypothetical protein